MRYPIALHTDDGEHYGVTVPDLPGCFSAGDSFDAAIESAKEAILAHLEVLTEDGSPIPVAGTIEIHRANPDFDGAAWEVVDVAVETIDEKIKRIMIRWDRWFDFGRSLKRLVVHPSDWRTMGLPIEYRGLPVKPLGI